MSEANDAELAAKDARIRELTDELEEAREKYRRARRAANVSKENALTVLRFKATSDERAEKLFNALAPFVRYAADLAKYRPNFGDEWEIDIRSGTYHPDVTPLTVRDVRAAAQAAKETS